ncbi:ribonuclease R, partial [Faecalibaculum rodentium]
LKDISKFEFLVVNGDQKVYVRKSNGMDAFDRDEVLVRKSAGGNRIIHIFKRGIENITGVILKTRDGWKFRSDVDLHTTFRLTNAKEFSLANNTKAVVKVVDYTRPLGVKIIRLLGPASQKGVDIEAMLYENNVRMEFPEEVITETSKVPSTVSDRELEGRSDFRDLLTVTIDGDHSKDFDDAISLEKTDKGYRLYVHIADVSHYVKEDSPLDKEALLRGNSVYVVDRVVPMLPFELSNGICSLNPDVDRLTLTAVMDLDNNGNLMDTDVVESVIHSDKRCTYNDVNRLLAGDPAVQEEYRDVRDMLKNFEELTHKLQARSKERGYISFSTKEPTIELDDKGRPVNIYVAERGFSEQMIEEAMIMANVAVAKFLDEKKIPGIFRVHETPDPEKVATVLNMAKALNVPADFYPDEVSAKDIQKFLDTIEDETSRDVLSMVALRSMQKARYDSEDIGHFGLALEDYTHFTSPIRRYSDLVVHRMLRKYFFNKNADQTKMKGERRKIQKEAEHISTKEREAITMERLVNDYEAARYMEKKVGQRYQGTVVGVANFGFFVELDNTVEGLVPCHSLTDDFYRYDEGTMSLEGENNHKTYRMGQKVDVICTDVDVPRGKITFGLA